MRCSQYFGRHTGSDSIFDADVRGMNHPPPPLRYCNANRGNRESAASNVLLLLVTTSLPCRHTKGEGKEEALEQLAMLVGAEHVDGIAEKFKVKKLSSASPEAIEREFQPEKK